MAYCVVRNAKVKKSGMYGLEKHIKAKEEDVKKLYEREIKEFGKSDIILENLKYNRVLKDCGDFQNEIKNQLKEKKITRPLRNDAVILYDSIVTYSPEKTPNLLCYLHKNDRPWLEEHEDWVKNYRAMNKDDRNLIINAEKKWVDNYFSEALNYYEKNMGVVLYAKSHYHETTPHLSIEGMPLSQNKKEKDGSIVKDKDWHLNWKLAVYDKKMDMSKFQTKFHEEVGKKYGLERGVVHETNTMNEHKSKLKWEVESLKTKVDKLDNVLNDLKAQISDLKSKYEDYLKLTQKQAQIENNALKRGVLPLKVERVMGKANKHKEEAKSIYDKLNQKTLTSFFEESQGYDKNLLDSFEEENKSYEKVLLHIEKVLDGEEEEDDFDR